MRLQFCRQSVEILTENPDLPNKLLMSDEVYFICMAQLISRTFDIGQLQILTNFINAPLMTQKLPYSALFGPEDSLDPTSIGMKAEKPSQSHRNITQMINEFLSPILPLNNGTLWFQQDGATAYTAVISIAALRRLFPRRVISRFGDVPWPPFSPDLTAPDFFFVELF